MEESPHQISESDEAGLGQRESMGVCRELKPSLQHEKYNGSRKKSGYPE